MPIEPHDPEEFDRALAPDPIAFPVTASLRLRGKRALQVMSSFLLGQGASQAINLLAGLFLVRSLSVEAYAQYGVATGFQTVFTILMDMGFAATIVPLVGDRGHDPQVVGRYVRAARHLRNRTFVLLAPVAAVCFLATVHKRHWSWSLQLLLLASVLVSLYSGGLVSIFSAPLFVMGKLREYYVPQVISGIGRLLAYVALALSGGMNAWTAAGIGALNVTLNGTLIRRASSRYLRWPEHHHQAADKELLKYVLPATPAIVFSAFQSQISLFLISIFGGTLNIAEFTALSRIGQIFLVLMTFNTIVIEPYMARLEQKRLLSTFAGLVALAGIACAPLVLIGFFWPGAFLLILGAKYEGLRPIIGWYVLSSCLSFLGGLIWIMNRGRKWVFWSGSILEVVLLLVIQIGFIATVGVRTTREAVFFSLCSACGVLIAHSYVTVRGFAETFSNKTEQAAV